MKIAVVHEWFVDYFGSERVVEQILQCYPEADLFAVVDFLRDDERGFLLNKHAKTTFVQKMPFARKHFRQYLPLMPMAIELLDLSSYDLIISSSHAVAKGVITGPNQVHVSYVHSPMRYAWDLQHLYLSQAGLKTGLKGWMVKWMLHKLRIWDTRSANGVDQFLSNSHYVARRIEKTYRREAKVIFPPADIEAFPMREDKEDFYLTASRMVQYKRVDLIIEAFAAMKDKRLIVIGDGPDFEMMKSKVTSNITLLGYQPFNQLRDYMQRAKAFIFASEEDLGLTPIEAQACGTPVIAYGRGGALETVIGLPTEPTLISPRSHHANREQSSPGPTGIFFEEQSAASIIDAVHRFETAYPLFSARECRANAQRFSPERFRQKLMEAVSEACTRFDMEATRHSSLRMLQESRVTQ